jgi:hypothetical protein
MIIIIIIIIIIVKSRSKNKENMVQMKTKIEETAFPPVESSCHVYVSVWSRSFLEMQLSVGDYWSNVRTVCHSYAQF